jgi:N4-gp56 family major capsid protein
MAATQSSDYAFEPKVWGDHIMAYFDRRLVYGAFALRDDTLTAEPGLTQTFPYFKKIGDAQEPGEDEGLAVDNLSDDSFSVTVKEVAKAVGASKKSFKKSAASRDRIVKEAQEQIGRVMAEKVDKDLIAEFSGAGNYTDGFTAAAAGDTMSIRNLNIGKIKAFGDKHRDSVVCFMHSLQFLDLMNDSTAGFLKADALDPMFMVEGFEGRLLGMAVVTVDTLPAGAAIGGKNSYYSFIHKMNAYGFMVKQDMEVESDYDILRRQWVWAGDQWYGVKSFHAKVDSLQKTTARLLTTVAN